MVFKPQWRGGISMVPPMLILLQHVTTLGASGRTVVKEGLLWAV